MNILRYIIRLTCVTGVALLAYAPAAYANEITTDFHVVATVPGTCTATALGNLNFGEYLGNAINNVPETIQFTCTENEVVHIGMGTGAHYSAGTRRMQNEPTVGNFTDHFLEYALYKASGCSTVWGPAGSDDLEVTATGALETRQVYGCLPAGQHAGAQGHYDDIVTVTFDF